MAPPTFYPGHTRVSGPGTPATNSFGDRARIWLSVGAGTHRDPEVCYAYEVKYCQWLTSDRRPFLEKELRKLARLSGMACVVVRDPPHNRMSRRTKTGELLTSRNPRSGRIEPETVSAEWHITILMCEDPEHCQVQGHVFTYMAPNPYGQPPPDKVIKIMDDPVRQRRDRRDLSMQFWLCRHVRAVR
ncbi:hypothetical protein QBC37DRAFT_405792 [Rhypophila decipiens]|uniref:Uncharacterized protein n=1 Tax=Rhypophila decipiens TaxID=261697 RepID=A0AAN7B4H5_9PEZI|nr:hypothetical protein QBC37DRAFT_405792 [Rhypophila decipiens]